MTNGEKLIEVFPSIALFKKNHDAIQINFDSVWWNAEYEEPVPDIDKCIEKIKHEKQCFIDDLWADTGEVEAYDMAIDTMSKFKALFQIMKKWAISEHPELTKVEYFDKIVELMNEKSK